MQRNLLVIFVLALSRTIWSKPLTTSLDTAVYAAGFAHGTNQELLVFPAEFHQPQKTEALINNTMVAGGMLYRFFRAIYRAGTYVYSYMPAMG
ncbi:hypothetical protein HUJ05_007036 [Dendroctonus ponderosae]|nr:hypothetical protein HUJ05_007036 [Dendroctonus ponderosae]